MPVYILQIIADAAGPTDGRRRSLDFAGAVQAFNAKRAAGYAEH